jgi:hypothetical protein
MQMETTLPASPASVVKTLVFSRVGRKHLLLGGLALALISGGLIWQWSWLVAVGVAPLLVSAVPCVGRRFPRAFSSARDDDHGLPPRPSVGACAVSKFGPVSRVTLPT